MGALRSAAALLAALLVVTGCDGDVNNPTMNGSPSTGGTGGGGTGGTGGSGGSGGSGGTMGGTGGGGGTIMMPDGGATDDGGAAQCIPAVTNPPDGHHNPGANCLLCHDSHQMLASLRWTVAGTLFDGLSSSNPTPGATIELIDADGQVITIPTATNGNFWTTQRVRFPLQVRASKCPSNLVMPSPTFDSSCNGCHVPGMRIHLP